MERNMYRAYTDPTLPSETHEIRKQTFSLKIGTEMSILDGVKQQAYMHRS
jgi:hypothetical protein